MKMKLEYYFSHLNCLSQTVKLKNDIELIMFAPLDNKTPHTIQ